MILYFKLDFYCTVNCNHLAQFDCLQSLVFQNKRSQYLKIIPYFMTSARRHKSIYLNETMPNARTKWLPFFCGVAQWTDVCGFASISFIVQVIKASHLSISLSLSMDLSLYRDFICKRGSQKTIFLITLVLENWQTANLVNDDNNWKIWSFYAISASSN